MKFLRGEYTPPKRSHSEYKSSSPTRRRVRDGFSSPTTPRTPSDAAQKETQTGRLEIITLPLLPPLPLPPPLSSFLSFPSHTLAPTEGNAGGGGGGCVVSPPRQLFLRSVVPKEGGRPPVSTVWEVVTCSASPKRNIRKKIEKGLTEKI